MTETPSAPDETNQLSIRKTEGDAAQGVFLPMKALKQIADYYHHFKWIGKIAGLKAPRDVDEALEEIYRGDNEGAEDLEKTGQRQREPYDIQQGELPEPRIGERVLTHDDGLVAWRMHYKQGLGYRDIANYFTNELGCPVSHTTISNYIAEIDEDMEENKGARLKTVATVIIVPVVIGVAGFLLGHFFFH